MKKIIEMDNNNNKNLEIKGINNYSCQDKKREVTWKEQKKFVFKSYLWANWNIYLLHHEKCYKSYNTFSSNCSFKKVDV